MDNQEKQHTISFTDNDIIILRALCDLALKSGGLHNLSAVSVIMAKISNIDVK